ncbi:unnamed protein product [Polarella glacialis]|uniref:Uncharacterized protein n=1 Tax=Polarella glacialis TaxID=89957 RepID=A0A813E132_POLGL|nr:unnamed protein product [Polarella glacialis]
MAMAARAAAAGVRRGVLMTSSRKRPAPEKPLVADVESDGEDDAAAVEKKRAESQREWSELEREARQEQRLKFAKSEFAQGRRETVAAYDDVGEVGNADGDEAPSDGDCSENSEEEDSQKEGPQNANDASERRPDAVVTAGKVSRETRDQRRGGVRKTGAQRVKAAFEEEEEAEKKRKAERDEERWVKLKLEGDQKPKRIDATRVVAYHDFDSAAAGGDLESSRRESLRPLNEDEEEEELPQKALAAPPPVAGNFRASLRTDLWDDDDDEEDG